MKQIILLAIVLAFTTSCKADFPTSDLSKLNLKGDIESIKMKTYNAEDSFGVVQKKKIRMPAIFLKDYEKHFNQLGYLTFEYELNDEGGIVRKYTYEYDSKNRITALVAYYGNGSMYCKLIHKYTEDGKINQSFKYIYAEHNESRTDYKYAENENVISTSTYNKEGSLIKHEKYEYEKNRPNWVKIIEYSSNDSILNQKELNYSICTKKTENLYIDLFSHSDEIITRKFSVDNKLLEETWPGRKLVFKYNDFGDKIEELYYDDEDKVVCSYEYKYKYDNQKNWIECVEIMDGKPSYIYERTINYCVISPNNKKNEAIQSSNVSTITNQAKWSLYEIENLGTISIPPTLELRTDSALMTRVVDLINNNSNSTKLPLYDGIVFQPKGSNEFNRESLKHYARVLIRITKGAPNDYAKINEAIHLTEKEKVQLNKILKDNFNKEVLANSSELLVWNDIEIISINGMTPIKASYIRKGANNSSVFVEYYMFHNYDELIELTLSYRISEESIWKMDFSKILSTFIIKNKKQL